MKRGFKHIVKKLLSFQILRSNLNASQHIEAVLEYVVNCTLKGRRFKLDTTTTTTNTTMAFMFCPHCIQSTRVPTKFECFICLESIRIEFMPLG